MAIYKWLRERTIPTKNLAALSRALDIPIETLQRENGGKA
jgi:hypothetical protein